MKYFLVSLLFLTNSVMALDFSEVLPNIRILQALPQNVVMINRGVEDGIYKGDHARLVNMDGYAARAVCLSSRSEASYWRLYRIVNPASISKDFVYKIVGMNDSELPDSKTAYKDENFKVPVKAEKEKPIALNNDLPERLTERDLIDPVGYEKRKTYFNTVVDEKTLARELSDYKFSLFASPVVKQTINNSESIRFGGRLENLGDRYRFKLQAEQSQNRLEDPETKESISTSSTAAQAQFSIYHLTNSVSSLSLINFNSARYSALATPKSHWQFGPLGYTWHLYENKQGEAFDLSYIPLLDLRTTEIRDKNGIDVTTVSKSGLRHGVRFGMKKKINERVALENLLWFRPYQDLSSWALELNNNNLVNDLKLAVNITNNFYVDYNFIYQNDVLLEELSGLSQTNVINSLTVRYDVNL
ncbi:MAG: hypothetical protein ACOVP4_04875 [Bacteriovoracaceae bacterium]